MVLCPAAGAGFPHPKRKRRCKKLPSRCLRWQFFALTKPSTAKLPPPIGMGPAAISAFCANCTCNLRPAPMPVPFAVSPCPWLAGFPGALSAIALPAVSKRFLASGRTGCLRPAMAIPPAPAETHAGFQEGAAGGRFCPGEWPPGAETLPPPPCAPGDDERAEGLRPSSRHPVAFGKLADGGISPAGCHAPDVQFERGSPAFGETAGSCGYCASNHPLQFLPALLCGTGGNCKEAVLPWGMGFPGAKTAPFPPYTGRFSKSSKPAGCPPVGFNLPSGMIKVRKGSGPLAPSLGFLTARLRQAIARPPVPRGYR